MSLAKEHDLRNFSCAFRYHNQQHCQDIWVRCALTTKCGQGFPERSSVTLCATCRRAKARRCANEFCFSTFLYAERVERVRWRHYCFHILSRSATKVRFCNCVFNSSDKHLIKRTQTTETSKTPDSTIRKPIGALRFETRKNVFPKRFLSWGFKTLFVAAGGGYRLSARSDVRSFHRRAANNQLAARISKYIFPCASVRGDGMERTSISWWLATSSIWAAPRAAFNKEWICAVILFIIFPCF